MAEAPPWGYDLGDTARWVAASGLPTRLEPPPGPLSPTQWRQTRDQTNQNRLTGLLVAAVARGDLAVEDDAAAQAGRIELDDVRRRLDYEHRIGGILTILDDAGVRTRVLKGLAVARLEYPDEMWRLTGDLDIAVPADELRGAVDTLVGHGGTWTDPEPTRDWTRLVGKGATVTMADQAMEVDLHRILVWGPFGVRLAPDALWGPGRHVAIGGVDRETLGREETLLHACVHQMILGVTRAREARDVAQMLTNPDLVADRVLHLARDWGVEAPLAVAIRLTERELDLTGDAHPLSDWAAHYRVTPREALWLRAGAPPSAHRIRGVEQAAVFVELGFGRRRERWHARRVLVRANLRPDPGTYAPPGARITLLAKRLGASARHRLGRDRQAASPG